MKEKDFKLEIIMLSMLAVVLLFLFILNLKLTDAVSINKSSIITQTQTKLVFDKYCTRLDVNDELINNKDLYYKSIGFYTNLTKNNLIATTIIEQAIKAKVPVNLVFALAFVESSFNVKAENKNQNGTTDKGLFQLNTRYNNGIDYFDPKENAIKAFEYLKDRYKMFQSWEIAVLLYNAGNVENVGDSSLRHMDSMLSKEREIDVQFNQFRRSVSFTNLQEKR